MHVFLDEHLGPLAGVATSVLWTATSLFFTEGGRRIGPTLVNVTRILFAIILLGLTHHWLTGGWLPQVRNQQVLYLALSGVIGLSIGDQALLTSFIDIGPRKTMLIMTTSPLIASLFGWLALGERLTGMSWFGIALTLGGVAWVVCTRRTEVTRPGDHHLRGLVLAFVGAACQAGGLFLSKKGIGHGWLPADDHLSPQTATLVRMVFAGVGMVPILAVHAYRGRTAKRRERIPGRMARMRAGILFSFLGAVTGPFLGVWMSLVAAHHAPLGVAQTLCSLAPVFILPVVVVIHGERVGIREILGAVVAVSGSALLFV